MGHHDSSRIYENAQGIDAVKKKLNSMDGNIAAYFQRIRDNVHENECSIDEIVDEIMGVHKKLNLIMQHLGITDEPRKKR